MSEEILNQVLERLDKAFEGLEKPDPMTTYNGSYCDDEVDHFNAMDWCSATYSDFVAGMEGAIICPAKTKLYLIPRLFKIVLFKRHGTASKGAEDNLSIELENWPVDEDVEGLLGPTQKAAIIAAWDYLDTYKYAASGSHVARLLAEHWKLEV